MTSPPPPFPAQIQVGYSSRHRLNGWGKSPAPGPTPIEVDAATWLAELNPVEVADAVYWRHVSLPHLADLEWEQPHLASLRPAWDQVKARSVANGDPADLLISVDLSGGPLIEWLHQNLFGTFLQFALMHLDVGEKVWSMVQAGRVGSFTGDDRDVKTLMLANINALAYSPMNTDSLDFDSTVDEIMALAHFCAVTNPKMGFILMQDLTPYLVGSTPQCEWMRADRALTYHEAGFTYGEARRSEFGAAADRPTDEMLATLAGLHVTSR